MAEQDAAGPSLPDEHPAPPPKAPPQGSLAAAILEMGRATAPLQAEIFRVREATAPLRAMQAAAEKALAPIRELERNQKAFAAAIDSTFGHYLREMVGLPAPIHLGADGKCVLGRTTETVKPAANEKPPRPAEGLAISVPSVTDTPLPKRTAPEPSPPREGTVLTPAAVDEIRAAVMPLLAQLAADMRREISALKKKPRSRGKTTCERLKDLFKRDPIFVVEATLEEIGTEIDRAAATVCESHYYKTKLQTLRDTHDAARALASRDAAGLAVDRDRDGH